MMQQNIQAKGQGDSCYKTKCFVAIKYLYKLYISNLTAKCHTDVQLYIYLRNI